MKILMKASYPFHMVAHGQVLAKFLKERGHEVEQIIDKSSGERRVIQANAKWDVIIVFHPMDIVACYKDIPVVHVPHTTGFLRGVGKWGFYPSERSEGCITDSTWGSRVIEKRLIERYKWNPSRIHFPGMAITDWILKNKDKCTPEYILYGPTCGANFKSFTENMINVLIKASQKFDIPLLVKPHPSLPFPKIEGVRVIYDDNVYPYLLKTALYVSDGSGLTADFMMLDRPLVIMANMPSLDVRRAILEYKGKLPICETCDQLENQLTRILSNGIRDDIYADSIRETGEMLAGIVDGRACERIEETLVKIINEGRKPPNRYNLKSILAESKMTLPYIDKSKTWFL